MQANDKGSTRKRRELVAETAASFTDFPLRPSSRRSIRGSRLFLSAFLLTTILAGTWAFIGVLPAVQAAMSGSDISSDAHPTTFVTLGDVDGDGDLDMLAGNYSQHDRLYLNNGTSDPFNGVTGSNITTEIYPTNCLALGDMDGDGDLDLVIGNRNQPNRLYLNNGTSDPWNGVTGSNITSDSVDTHFVILGDVDGDGDLDMVAGNVGATNRLYLNDGTGTTWTSSDITSDIHDTFAVNLGDLDGDGDLDLVAGNQLQANRLYLNNGTSDPWNGVSGSDILTYTESTHFMALGDVDGDGDLDIVAGNANFGENRLSLNNGTATAWTDSLVATDSNWTASVALGDVDGDGDLDLVTGNYNPSNLLYLNNGTADPWNGVVGKDITTDTGGTLSVALGDVDGDGNLDLVAGNYNNQINRLYLNIAAQPTLSIADVTVDESAGTATFTVTLSATDALPITVDYATSDDTATAGADYTASSDTLSLPAGSISGTFTVAINDDALDENNETFTVTLSTPTNATIADGTAVATITDNDTAPTLSIADVTVDEGAGIATFTATLSAVSGLEVVANYATSDDTATAGTDYTTSSGTLPIPAGSISGTFTVAINDDAIDENNETFTVTLSTPTNATIADGTAVATITDNDTAPTLSIADVTVDEGAGIATFTATLSAVSGLEVVANYATSADTATAGADYTTSSGTLSIPAGSTSGTFTVAINDDALDENNETFTVTLSTPTNATIADGTAVATITDNDTAPTLSIADVTVDEGAGIATFTVTLSAVSGLDVAANYATTDGTATAGADYTASSGNLSILAGSISGTFTVAINDDALDEGSETFTVTLSTPTNATIADGTAVVTITDDGDAPTMYYLFLPMVIK